MREAYGLQQQKNTHVS